jgi:hypothetical protein
MYKKNFLILILLLLCARTAWAQNSKGEILFFPDQQPRPANDRFEVKAGQEVEVCIKVEAKAHPLLEEVTTKTTGFRLVLEDNQTPPNAIVIQEEPKKNYLTTDARGCYVSRFKVPLLTAEGVYQAADLLFKLPGRGFVSIHQLLYDFSQADELLVHNPSSDTVKPSLVQISTLQQQVKKIARSFDFYKINVKQEFTFEETGSGLDPQTLKIYYKLLENGERTGIYLTQCHKFFKKKNKFECKLELTRPQYQWEMNRLALQLDSIYLKDKAGNQLVLEDQAAFKKAAGETPIEFDFEKKVPASKLK